MAPPAAARTLAGDDMALVLHAHGDGQRLAPRPGAEIRDTHAGLGITAGDKLAALILDFHQPVLKRLAG